MSYEVSAPVGRISYDEHTDCDYCGAGYSKPHEIIHYGGIKNGRVVGMLNACSQACAEKALEMIPYKTLDKMRDAIGL